MRFLVLCALGVAAPNFHAQQIAASSGPPENLHLYLLIGQSNMAGRAEIPEGTGATVVVNVLNRDRKYAREFLTRHQDKLLWATDEGWWSFADKSKPMNRHHSFLEELDLPDEVRHKIYRGNAERVYGLRKDRKQDLRP